MDEEGGERPRYEDRPKRPYIGGGNRFDKAGEPRPYESRRSQSRNYKGTPRFARDEGSAPPAEGAERSERPRFERADRPAFGGKPSYGGKPRFGGPGGGFKKSGDFKKPGGFKKKYVGKAAGAKGSYKGGKAFRNKSG